MNLLVIPAHNEASTVAQVVRATREAMPGAEIAVIDDGSSDATAHCAAAAGATVLQGGPLHGYGAALMRGFRHAVECGASTVATLDADGQHDPRSLPALHHLLRHCDIASGSRYHPSCAEGVGAAPLDRMDINRELTAHINAITGWTLTDAFCGFKAYRVEALRRLVLDEPGYGFPLQLWVEAWRAGLTVAELPVRKIYLPVDRLFGDGLDDAAVRRAYYGAVLERTLARSAPATGA